MTKNAQNANDERLVAHQDGGNDLEELRLWHSIQSSSRKWYSYRFTLGPMLSPMERFTRSQFVHRPSFQPSSSSSGQPYALTTDDIARLKSILEVYVGTHDFKAFGGQIEQIEKRALRKINTIRTIHKVELVKESRGYDFASSSELKQIQLGFIGEEGNYRIDFLIDGALYKMVRNMVGAAMDVWLGNMERTQLIELLRIDQSGDDGKSRKDNPCKPAPPEGLTLECVYYDDSF
jgi:tRNA pseudouridine38-40 synthase